MDKSDNFEITDRKTYNENEGEHLKLARKISETEVRQIQGELNEHSSAFQKIFRVGKKLGA